MAMSRTSWSINALATEFNMDRRTVGKRLENVVPYELGPDGSPRWRLSDAAAALVKPSEARSGSAAPPPPGARILTKVPDQLQAGFVIAWLDIVTNIKPVVASALMMSGLPLEQAKRGTDHVLVFLVSHADSAMKKLGVPPWVQEEEPSWVPLDLIQEPNWKGLVEKAEQERAADRAAPKGG